MTAWNKERIQTLLISNDDAIKRGLLVLYGNQTAEERDAQATHDRNNVGFTGVDAKILSSFAQQLIGRGFLSRKQMEITRKKLPKYWRKLQQEIIRREEAGKVVEPVAAQTVAPIELPVEPSQGDIFGSFA